jgi:hypothetical protein
MLTISISVFKSERKKRTSMMSDYSYSCSILEPIMETFFPCGEYLGDDGVISNSNNTPIRSNCTSKDLTLHSGPSIETETTAAMSSSNSERVFNPNVNNDQYCLSPPNAYDYQYHHHNDSRYHQRTSQVDEQYGTYNHVDPSPWYPPSSRIVSWREEGNYSPSYWQQPEYRQAPPPQHYSRTNHYSYSAANPMPAPEVMVSIPGAVDKISTVFTKNSIESKRDLRPLDIVCGRGAPTNYHYGNQVFRGLVEEQQTSYLCAKRSAKPQIAMNLLDQVKSTGGRFVRRQKTSEGLVWTEIKDRGAYEKICQALRDGAPDLRQKMLTKYKKLEGETAGKENNGTD